ncbi:hypothetical protein PG984_001076 [Apiospora sp. TS-2023a]
MGGSGGSANNDGGGEGGGNGDRPRHAAMASSERLFLPALSWAQRTSRSSTESPGRISELRRGVSKRIRSI